MDWVSEDKISSDMPSLTLGIANVQPTQRLDTDQMDQPDRIKTTFGDFAGPDYVFASRPISDLCKFCQKLIPAIQQFEVHIERSEVLDGNTKRNSKSISRDDIASDVDPDNNLEADKRSGTKALGDVVNNEGFQDTANEEMIAESGDQSSSSGSLQGVSYYSGLWRKLSMLPTTKTLSLWENQLSLAVHFALPSYESLC